MKAFTAPRKAAHLSRQPDPAPRRAARPALVETVYPPGHFTKPCRAWFGKHWPPTPDKSHPLSSATLANLAKANAAKREGKGWGLGTVPMPGTPKHKKPGAMA